MIAIITIIAISAEAQDLYIVTLELQDGNVVSAIRVSAQGYLPKVYDGAKYEVRDEHHQIISSDFFSFPATLIGETAEAGKITGTIEFVTGTISIIVPALANAYDVRLTDESGKEIAVIDLAKDDIQTFTIPSNRLSNAPNASSSSTSYLLWIAIIGIIMLAGIGFFLWRKKNKSSP